MEITLKTKLTGVSHGQECKLQPYVCRLGMSERGHVLFEVGQPFADGSIGWMAGWRLKSLLDGKPNDDLYIDFGQDWKVQGMWAALKEALRHVEFKFKQENQNENHESPKGKTSV